MRFVLLTSLPLTGCASSTKVTVRLVSQVSLNVGLPNTGVAGHSIVSSAGQLTTVGLLLSITVMVWLQLTEVVCASVAVQVRFVLLTSLPLTVCPSSTKVTVRLVSQVFLYCDVANPGLPSFPTLRSSDLLTTVGLLL